MNSQIEILRKLEGLIDQFEYDKPPRNDTWCFHIEGDEESGYKLYESHLESVVYPEYDMVEHKSFIGKSEHKSYAELYINTYHLLKDLAGQEENVE